LISFKNLDGVMARAFAGCNLFLKTEKGIKVGKSDYSKYDPINSPYVCALD